METLTCWLLFPQNFSVPNPPSPYEDLADQLLSCCKHDEQSYYPQQQPTNPWYFEGICQLVIKIKLKYPYSFFSQSCHVLYNKQNTLPSNWVLHSCNSSGPAARWIRSLNTPLLLRDSLVVFTIAMVFSLVRSPHLRQDIWQNSASIGDWLH